jgi:hypothetical protein
MLSLSANPVAVKYGDKLSRGYRVMCERCGKCEHVHINTMANAHNKKDNAHATDLMLARKLDFLGWRTDKRLLCPDCREKRAKQMRKLHAGTSKLALAQANAGGDALPASKTIQPDKRRTSPHLDNKPAESATKAPSAPSAPSVDESDRLKPPPMEDRRIILMELNDFYSDTGKGYKGDWTDAKLAAHIGAPEVWVRMLREENFGPPGNPELDLLKTEVANLQQSAREVADALKTLALANDSLIATAESLRRRIEDAKS